MHTMTKRRTIKKCGKTGKENFQLKIRRRKHKVFYETNKPGPQLWDVGENTTMKSEIGEKSNLEKEL